MKKDKADTFPLIISKAHASVKIYRTRNRGKTLYCLSYVDAGAGRVRKNFADLSEAKREANTKVGNLAKGDVEGAKLGGRERQIYVAAVEALAPTGVSLDIAAREFAAAFEILGHDGIIEAARFYRKHVDSDLPDITTAAAVERFTAAKESEGKSKLYLKDIRLILGRLKDTFVCNIKAITADDLQSYMQRLSVGPVAKNNHRRLIVALFNFAKNQGWLRKDETTAADALGTIDVVADEVEIYKPAEVARLLTAADEDFLPWVALIAFGGVRREELAKGLKWDAINFERNTVTIPASIAKTKRKRKIEMQANLRAWLEPYQDRTGAIFRIDPRKRMEKTLTTANKGKEGDDVIVWKRNGLRHSFGSYRMDQTKNEGQVSLEMGNSAKVVKDHYFEIIDDSKDTASYWTIMPAPKGKVVPMPSAA